MGIIKKILTTLWALWGAFWFMVVISILTPIYALILLLTGRKYALQCIWTNCRVACPFLLNICLIDLKVYGKEKIDTARTYVFVSNHGTSVDVWANAAAMPKPMFFLAKSELIRVPVFGFMVKMLAIMVDRKSKESREKSLRYLMEELKKGNSIFIYPEGTRNRTGAPLKEFKDGAFRAAIAAQVPVAVQTIVGARKVNNPDGWHLQPGTIEIFWSTPIETAGMTEADLPLLREKVQQEMLGHLTE